VTATVTGTRQEIELDHALARDEANGDGRFYLLFAGTEREERFRSVTAATGRWDKDGLKIWAAGLSANEAFEVLPSLVAALVTPDCGRSWHTRCSIEHDWNVRCPDCRCRECQQCLVRHMRDRHHAESKRRSDEGTRVHEIVGHWATTGIWMVPDDDIAVYIHSFKAFVAEYGLTPEDWEMTEARVINREYMYAGTLDAMVHLYRGRTKATDDILDRLTAEGQPRVQHALVLVDYKSREKLDRAVFLDMPLQLAGYRFAQTIVLKDGTELPMLKVDAAAIIQIRPDKTQFVLVLAEEPEFAAFLNLLGADDWALVRGKRAIEANTFKYAESVTKLRQADQRRAAKERKQLEAAAAAAGEWVAEPAPVATETPAAATPAPSAPTAAERGARAAAAVGRGVRPALADLAQAHGKPVGKKLRTNQPLGAKIETLTASVLGMPSEAADDEIPF
jgi:hypothetical protein